MRQAFTANIGNIAVENAWKVSQYSTTQLLVSPGISWFDGLPFQLNAGTDPLVTLGTAPAGVALSYEPTGLGVLLTFTTSSTPTNTYRIVVTAQEDILTTTQDPYLQNINVPEATSSKVRVVYTVNVVLASNQGSSTPYDQSSIVPYLGESGSYNTITLSNIVQVTATSSSGYLISTNSSIPGENIDGRTAELTIANPSGNNFIPNLSADQAQFEYGSLIDQLGNEYVITAIFNSITAGEVVIRISQAPGSSLASAQPLPTLPSGASVTPYYIVKQDVYYGSDTTGAPTGTLHYHIANVTWNTTSGFVHPSVVTDIRDSVVSESDYQELINKKFDLVLSGGGVISVGTDGETLKWNADFSLISPSGPVQTIRTGSQVIYPGGSLVYNLNFAGGNIDLGQQALTVSSTSGTLVTLSGSPSLTSVRLGNTLVIAGTAYYITAIDNVNKTLTVNASVSSFSGPATAYLDSFAPGTAPNNENTYTLAVSNASNGIITVGGVLQLSAGHTNAIYDEIAFFSSGVPALTPIALPNNSRNTPGSPSPQFYNFQTGELQVFVNTLYTLQQTTTNPVADWIPVSNSTIAFNYALPPNTQVHFRIDTLPSGSVGGTGGGGGGGGSASLQTAYNNGSTILTSPGVPFTVDGASGNIAVFNGDIEVVGKLTVTGAIDPTGLQLIPQASNPLTAGQYGLWIDTSGNLIHQLSSSNNNITQQVANLTSGAGIAVNSAGAITGGASTIGSGLAVNVDGTTTQITSNAVAVKLDTGATTGNIVSSGSGLKNQLETVNPTLQVVGNQLAVNLDTRAITSGPTGIGVNIDNATLAITSNVLSVATSGITSVQLADASVTAAKLGSVTDGITLDQSGTGSTIEIKTGGVGTTQLASSAVTPAKLSTITDGITLDQSGTGSTLEIKAGGVGPTQIGTITDGITLDQLGIGNTIEIKTAGVNTTQLANAAVTPTKLGSVTDGVTLDQSGAGSTIEIKVAGVGTTQLANSSVTSAKLGTITDGITLDQSGAGATLEIKTGGVSATNLGSVTDGITLDQSGAGSTLEIKSAGVGTTQLANSSVTAAKLGSVTDGITLDQSGAGSTIEIKTGGVGTTQLSSQAVTSAKIATTAVDGTTITGGNGTALSVQQTPKLATTQITGATLSANTSYLVRWALNGDTTPGDVYLADPTAAATNNKYLVFGITGSAAGSSIGNPVTILSLGNYNLQSSDVDANTGLAFTSAQVGLAVYSWPSGGFSTTPPSTIGYAVYRVGILMSTNTIWMGTYQLNGIN